MTKENAILSQTYCVAFVQNQFQEQSLKFESLSSVDFKLKVLLYKVQIKIKIIVEPDIIACSFCFGNIKRFTFISCLDLSKKLINFSNEKFHVGDRGNECVILKKFY